MTVAQDLAGRRAVITGGAQGLGRAIAERLAVAGAAITIVDLDAAHSPLPVGWDMVVCDLGSPAAQEEMRQLAERLGSVDIVVANAGVVPPWRRVVALDRAEWEAVMAVNVWGVAITLGAFADALAQSGRGAAIVMASINGYKAHPEQVLYSASKHAVIGVMRAAALDLGARGVRVNALAPGPIATEALLSRIARRHAEGGPDPEKVLAGMAADTALGRLASPQDVANAAHFLASDAAAGITGKVLPIEAGLA
ncbi:SDR family NAD(P)-dependent oxidoreductase [Oceanibium sediminis]|uniref:SDR family NAD(P)-dependent oxidoreductase n=1 Tax=Oceanibium sediminis TaxID=2026339 RepID=UPI000DD47292|nr:SDR family oxidoreductase [Oceanibium sediminis]